MDGRSFYFPGYYCNDNSQLQPQYPFGYEQYFNGEEVRSAPNQSTSNITRNTSSANEGSQDKGSSTKRSYDKWSDAEQKMLIRLWADNFERIESKETRKAWDNIADEINNKFGANRTSDKYNKKMKYWIERYKIAKDWNTKQTGGNRRKSVFFDEIDEILGCRDVNTLRHVEEAGSSSSSRTSTPGPSTPSTSRGDDDNSNDERDSPQDKREKRKERKKSSKKAREEEKNDEERGMFTSALQGLESQRSDMNSFINNFNRIQEQQLNTMNALAGALTQFLQKQ